MLLITLQDLLVRPASLDWFEAVAIVQAVCTEALRLAHGGSPTIPGRHGVLLTAEGGVEFTATGASPAQPPVIGAATLLHDLLSPDSAPEPLRSVVSSALASPGQYRSLDEFSRSLEYFERPDRARVVREVFQRVEAAAAIDVFQPPVEAWGLDQFPSEGPDTPLPKLPSPAGVELPGIAARDEGEATRVSPLIQEMPGSTPAIDCADEAPASIPKSTAEQEHRRESTEAERHFRWTAALAVGGTAGVFLLAIGLARGGAWQASKAVEHPLTPAPPAVLIAAALPPSLSPIMVSPDLGAGADSAAGSWAAEAASGEGRERVSRVPAATPPARDMATTGKVARDVAPAPAARAQSAAPAEALEAKRAGSPAMEAQETARAQPVRASEVPGPSAGADSNPREAGRIIYSPADASVRPPVAIRTRYWTQPPPGIPVETLTRIEILVSEKGEVESSRIVAGPRTYFDGQIVSAVKGWTFKPATLDGRPVAYRQQVWLAIAQW